MQGNTQKTHNPQKEQKRVAEMLEAIGQEDEHEGIKATKYFMDQFEKKNWEEDQFKQDRLEKATKYSRHEYHKILAMMLDEEARQMDIPFELGYKAWTEFTEDGVILRMTDRWGRKYHKAFRPSGIPKVDFFAVVTLLSDLQGTADTLEQAAIKKLRDMGLILGG